MRFAMPQLVQLVPVAVFAHVDTAEVRPVR